MNFTMYAVADSEGNLVRGAALDRHMRNRGADWQTRNAAADAAAWERSRALQQEALRLARLHRLSREANGAANTAPPVPIVEPTPEPVARWTGSTAIRAPFTPGGINHVRNRN